MKDETLSQEKDKIIEDLNSQNLLLNEMCQQYKHRIEKLVLSEELSEDKFYETKLYKELVS